MGFYRQLPRPSRLPRPDGIAVRSPRHRLRCAFPHSLLTPFVQSFAQREIDCSQGGWVQSLPGRLEQIIEFQFDEAYTLHGPKSRQFRPPRIAIIGLYTRNDCSICFDRRTTSFAIFFQPDGFSRLYGIPQSELSHNAFDARDLVGEKLNQLHEELNSCPSFHARVRVAERHLIRRAAAVTEQRDVIQQAAAHIFAQSGCVRVSDIADASAVSLRQFERRFVLTIGLGAKLFARLARFQSALDMKLMHPRRTWLDVAHDVGYHDQTHMVRDFHHFAGAAPNDLLSRLGDARPESLILSDPSSVHTH